MRADSTNAADPSAALRGSRALVTGGAGFIGSHLVSALLELGAEVVILDDLSSGSENNARRPGVEFHRGTVTSPDDVAAAARGATHVFHLAALVSVVQSVEDPAECVERNIVGTQRVLEAAKAAGARRLVLASSAAVYGGEPRLPSAEDDPTRCESPYAASKLAGEALCRSYATSLGLETAPLRFFNVYGVGQDPLSPYSAVIPAFVRAAAAGRRPRVDGDGLQTRDFVHVRDVARACVLASVAPGAGSGIPINIGSGSRITLLDLLGAMERRLGRAIERDLAPARTGDVRHSVASIERAARLLGYRPTVSLDEGLGELLEVSAGRRR